MPPNSGGKEGNGERRRWVFGRFDGVSTNGLSSSSSSPARGLTSSFSGARLPSASFSSCGSTCSTPDGLIDSLLRMPSAIPNSPEPCLDVIPGSAPIAARSPGESRTTALFSLSSPRSNMSPRTFSLSVSQPSSSSASVWSSNDERDARCFRSRATGTWEVKGEKVRPGVSRELEPSEGRRPGRGRAGAVFSASESASESRMARGRAAGRRAAADRAAADVPAPPRAAIGRGRCRPARRQQSRAVRRGGGRGC